MSLPDYAAGLHAGYSVVGLSGRGVCVKSRVGCGAGICSAMGGFCSWWRVSGHVSFATHRHLRYGDALLSPSLSVAIRIRRCALPCHTQVCAAVQTAGRPRAASGATGRGSNGASVPRASQRLPHQPHVLVDNCQRSRLSVWQMDFWARALTGDDGSKNS